MSSVPSMYRDDIPLQDENARHQELPDWRDGPFMGVKPYMERVAQLAKIAESDPQLRPKWRELRDWYEPEAGRYLNSSFCYGGLVSDDSVKSSQKNIVNGATTQIVNTCAAGLKYANTSAQKPWFIFSPSDKSKVGNTVVRLWLDATRDTVRDALAQSNFYSEMDKVYKEASLFGFGVLFSEPDPVNKLNYIALTVGECVLDENARGEVDTCYWRMEMTAKQIVEKFGKDNKGLTDEVKTAINNAGSISQKFVVFRAVQPINTFGDAPIPLMEDWKYESVYFLDGSTRGNGYQDKRTVLRWEWHRTRPFVAVRWRRTSRHVYGTCPGKDCLPDQKMLQAMTANGLDATEMSINPPLLAGKEAFDNIKRQGRIAPGSVIEDNGTNRQQQSVQAIYQVQPDFNNFRIDREEVIQRIRDAFYYDQWRAIINIERQMTAFEVDARLNEKISLLAPVVESFESQGHTPIIERAYSICLWDLGLIEPPPQEMLGQGFRVEYDGDYVKSIKQVEVERAQMFINNAIQQAAGLAQISPNDAADTLKTINFKEATTFISTRYDVSPEIMRTEEEIAQIDQQQAEAAQAQQQAMATQQMIDGAEQLGNTPMGGDTALSELAGAI